MTKVLVAHTATTFGEQNTAEELHVNVGDTFAVIEEPKDFLSAMILMQFADDPDAIVADLGIGYMVFSEEPDEQGRSLRAWFDLKEVS